MCILSLFTFVNIYFHEWRQQTTCRFLWCTAHFRFHLSFLCKQWAFHHSHRSGTIIFFHLYPQWFRGGTGWRQVLQLARPLVGEHCSRGFVLAIPLDGPAAVQEVLVRAVASQRKEIAGLGHLLDADVSSSFGNQADVDVACRTTVGVASLKNPNW